MSKTNVHHNVYVIQLRADVVKETKFLAENPHMNPSLPCYYVGITGLTLEKRFNNHKNRNKASRIARKYGMHLVPELYEELNPMTYEEAKNMEPKLAMRLRSKGHGIWQK